MSKELPSNWVELTIGELTEVVSGGTPSTSKPEYFDGEIPWITPADLSGYKEKYISTGRRNISTLGLRNSSARLLPAGTVLFSSRAPIGYVAIAKNELCTNQGFKNLLPNEAFDSSYAYYYLTHLKKYAESQASGTTFKELSGKKMAELPFLLPPLTEQKRIAVKLDEAFARLDTLKAKLERIPELLKSFRKAVLTQAITGKLTKVWREDNEGAGSASELISRIRSRRQVKFKVNLEASSIGADERTIEIPETWERVRVGEIATLINGDRGKNYPNASEYVYSGLPFINTGHIEPNGSLDKSNMNFITREKYNTLNGGKITKGDLVYCLRGATLGKTAIVDMYDEGAIASSLVIIRPDFGICNWYLYYYLISPFGKEVIKRFDNGSAQPNLSANSVKTYPLSLPPEKEQQEIARCVRALFAKADTIESIYYSLKTNINNVPKSLLAKAFRGELMLQDENA